ncbi:MAG: urea carboxylase [Parvibaculum sp.]|jgi:urea carboxylase|uniref:urea carboxylase n=1 Tax=Parvibaculum sp. TaxID=2024848 RepID=UPI000C5C6230|nr:urea carboxylase [Parvibaculum sp.]MAU59397.1 urea carboxylase [Parvibaculum sp.]|tara:strand:- start:521 stop:4141 length:3621 start_codon:yes stop_codon:yes gene_type:complete
MFDKVLIANRGEIALRVIKTLRRMGIRSVAVYSEADRFAPHVHFADEAVCVGPAPVAESYLNVEAILAAVRETGAEAVHPGYGFLSENPEFAAALAREGVAFIGPRPEHMRAFSLKHTAREIAEKSGVPLLPGSPLIVDLDDALTRAGDIGYPVMLKSTAGGGGIGLQLCHSAAELPRLYDTVRRLALANFKDSGLFLEKFVAKARHIEVQIFGDGEGNVIALGERDCSAQRRNQKVIEETPAPNLGDKERRALHEAAVNLGEAVSYASAGTVEFIYDEAEKKFYFLEVNTRLQVEHPVTEEVTGLDLVEMMVRQAAGELDDLSSYSRAPKGHAFEVRLYAEDPGRNFQPSSGLLTEVSFPGGVRIDGWIETGTEVTPFYDPMLAKVIVKGETRAEAAAKLAEALDQSRVYGIETNLDYLRSLARAPEFLEGKLLTSTLATYDYESPGIDVLSPGAQSSLQDYPGRLGYWDVGVPPSGPMDGLSHRLANRLVGNPEEAATLEMTLNGPALKFRTDAVIALAGAEMPAKLDGEPVPFWVAVEVKRDQTLELGQVAGAGQRAYLAVRHGFDAPVYLGSRSAFTLGRFGGHAPGALRTGDVLRINREGATGEPVAEPLPQSARTPLTREWEIATLYGPHGAPDFFLDEDIETLFNTAYEVHYNSARTGVRLIGPKPKWARKDGGEAGLHPSNIHDNAYAVGTIDFTGDMPIILGPDGPSLGGFVCPATLAKAELWKIGQLKPGDKVRFHRITEKEAAAMRHAEEGWVASLKRPVAPVAQQSRREDAVLGRISDLETEVTYRRAGDDYLLVEYGPIVLDFALRFRAHAMMMALEELALEGIIEMTPGIRSLQIHFDPDVLPSAKLLATLEEMERKLGSTADIEVPSRIVHLPLSWDDAAAQEAVRKYGTLVRPDAPWVPSNIEFIRRINGLDSIADVKRILFEADYMVFGLGDVYLGAPVATPLDPRHRLVTTKYNPARTWTPENAVGIGGAYLCVYGMEGPGGYQLVGRTVQMWNSWRKTKNFEKPWLLRFFDRLKFFPVSAEELLEARDAFPHGKYEVKVEEGTFRLSDYFSFLEENAKDIAAFRVSQRRAFEAERQRWEEQGLAMSSVEPDAPALEEVTDLPEGGRLVESGVPGNVWSIGVEPGDEVAADQTLVVLESMKMEIEVRAPVAARVHEVHCAPGKMVQAGQALVTLVPLDAETPRLEAVS